MNKKTQSQDKLQKPTLVEVMHRMDFDAYTLIGNAYMMGYNSGGTLDSLNVEQIISKLSEEILANPRTVLMRLPFEELVILQIMKEIPPDSYYAVPRTNHVMAMAQIGLALQFESDDNNAYDDVLTVAEDFRKACIPIIDEVLENEYVKMRATIEELLIGIINIYGALSEDQLFELLRKKYVEKDEEMEIFEQILFGSIALNLMETYSHEKDDYFYLSPFALDVDKVLSDIDGRPEIKSFKHFNISAIAEAGNMPIPALPNPYNNRIMEILEKRFGYTEKEAKAVRLTMWQDVQESDMGIGGIIQHVIGHSPKKDFSGDLETLNSALQDISNYLNHAPRWKFKGLCPDDLVMIGDKTPKIVLGPNMRRSGYDPERVQQMVDQAWAKRKVGRNDPCPCGSGKKYKNCCGKGY